jgi:hypothetical protein
MPAAAAAQAGPAEHFSVTRESRPEHHRGIVGRALGVLVSLLLLLLLIAQLAWWQREKIIVQWPPSASLYAYACKNLGCVVTPPRHIDGLQIEQTALRQVDDPHHLELKLGLRNRDRVTLAYPTLEITLMDHNNQIALRRVVWPQDYLPAGTPVSAGLPAQTTQPVTARLDTGNIIAANYRVQIFYP